MWIDFKRCRKQLTQKSRQDMVSLVPHSDLDTGRSHRPRVYRSGAGCGILSEYSPNIYKTEPRKSITLKKNN